MISVHAKWPVEYENKFVEIWSVNGWKINARQRVFCDKVVVVDDSALCVSSIDCKIGRINKIKERIKYILNKIIVIW